MWFSSYETVRLALLSLVFGAVAGAYYDIFRILRIARKPSCESRAGRIGTALDAVLCAAGDLFFWITLACAYCVFIYDAANGRLRIVSLIACAAGGAAWYFTVGRLTALIAEKIVKAVRRAVRFAVRITVVPAFKVIKFAGSKIFGVMIRVFGAVYGRCAARRERKLAKKGYGII